MPSSEKKFTLEQLRESFRQAVKMLNNEELEELRGWLERVTFVKLISADEIAAAWLRVSLGHRPDSLELALEQLEEAGAAPEASSKHLAELSPPPRDRRN
jgi:hypothetical protein